MSETGRVRSRRIPLIATMDKSLLPWRRRTGIYGHWPRNGYAGYLRLVTRKRLYTLWYFGNPHRGHLIERCSAPVWRPSRFQQVSPGVVLMTAPRQDPS